MMVISFIDKNGETVIFEIDEKKQVAKHVLGLLKVAKSQIKQIQ